MRAVDTNILVRFLTKDDLEQAKTARTILLWGDVFVSSTVVLETEWVLRAAYRFSPGAVEGGLRAVSGLPGLTLEEPLEVSQALDWLGAGMDFADALHLAKSARCSSFVTFDRNLARKAKALSAVRVEVI